MATQTKAELEAEVVRLRTLNEHQTQLLEEAGDTISTLEKAVVNASVDSRQASVPTPAIKEVSEDDVFGEPELVSDPFSTQNPHAIVANPPGFVLRWINPKYRASRGWQGWIRVEWDDEIGNNLSEYLNEVPDRMEGAVDNYVRRGDVILCRLPEVYFRLRERQRNAKVDAYRPRRDADLRPDSVGGSNPHETPLVNGQRLGGRTLLS